MLFIKKFWMKNSLINLQFKNSVKILLRFTKKYLIVFKDID